MVKGGCISMAILTHYRKVTRTLQRPYEKRLQDRAMRFYSFRKELSDCAQLRLKVHLLFYKLPFSFPIRCRCCITSKHLQTIAAANTDFTARSANIYFDGRRNEHCQTRTRRRARIRPRAKDLSPQFARNRPPSFRPQLLLQNVVTTITSTD